MNLGRVCEMTICFNPIGIIRTPFKQAVGIPIQPSGAKGVKGTIELKPEFGEGLKDLEGFSHIILIYHFHKSKKHELIVTPFLDSETHGVFATRAPNRPNPVGISIVKLLKIKSNILHIEHVDIIDKTPLIDIKPYVPEFDKPSSVKTGWLEKKKGSVIFKKSDNRFGSE
jgi:tRNA (adenine37-N6)-methyltransferase